jgi:acyl-CoA dehydrogenase
MSAYKVSLRELRFFLWELLDAEASCLAHAPYTSRDRAYYDSLLEKARDFALDLGKSYHASDVESCSLREDGTVSIPSDFHALWPRFREEWSGLLFDHKTEEADQHEAPGASVPMVIRQVIFEMLMGANPSFMTYGGFTHPACKLLTLHGTPEQKALRKPLLSYAWDACFCATEPQAGSDMTAVQTLARPLGDDVYAVSGEKVYISAGMHDLTENTLYFVLGRIDSTAADSFSLSCLIVPRFWRNETTGELESNHVECIGLPRKMGLKGCANTHLVFGRSGTTRAYLLGNRKNVGLLQLVPLMNQARMGTGLFGIGVASSAYLQAVSYARRRIQGRRIEAASDVTAPRVRIIEHGDVQRMLLDMKARVEGCRGLLGKLTAAATQAAILRAMPDADPELIERQRKLQLLLTPICKAFISDQAWRVCETAIQVHGGLGYTDASPVEQNARDVKILSIWEGTNYIQAQDLVREKLGFGRNSILLRYFLDALDASFARIEPEASATLAPRFLQLRASAAALEQALASITEAVKGGHMHASSQVYTRFLEMFGMVAAAWSLLEAACIAERRLGETAVANDVAEAAFYRGKVKVAHYFFTNLLPTVAQHAAVIGALPETGCAITAEELAEVE